MVNVLGAVIRKLVTSSPVVQQWEQVRPRSLPHGMRKGQFEGVSLVWVH